MHVPGCTYISVLYSLIKWVVQSTGKIEFSVEKRVEIEERRVRHYSRPVGSDVLTLQTLERGTSKMFIRVLLLVLVWKLG